MQKATAALMARNRQVWRFEQQRPARYSPAREASAPLVSRPSTADHLGRAAPVPCLGPRNWKHKGTRGFTARPSAVK